LPLLSALRLGTIGRRNANSPNYTVAVAGSGALGFERN